MVFCISFHINVLGDESEYIRWWALQFPNVKLRLAPQVGGGNYGQFHVGVGLRFRF